MKNWVKRCALLLVLVMLLTSLGGCDLIELLLQLSNGDVPGFVIPVEPSSPGSPDPGQLEFVLTGQDIKDVQAQIEACKALSYSDTATRAEVTAAWETLDEKLSYISAQTLIAQVLYYQNLKDKDAEKTYLDTHDIYLELADQANMLQKDMYMDSPVKDWFFDDWPQADIAYLLSYTPEIAQIQSQIAQVETQFQQLENHQIYEGYTDLYVRLVTLGNEMARLSGYENYYDYTSALYYNRDYGKAQREQFRSHVKNVLIPNFQSFYIPLDRAEDTISEQGYNQFLDFQYGDFDKVSPNYLESYLESLGGNTRGYMNHMFEKGNYLATDSRNSFEGAFCADMDYYDMSFCYFGPGYQSTSTVVHEMGHYYANFFVDDYTPMDLLETHSQGNEMLLLAHMKELVEPSTYDLIQYSQLYEHIKSLMICCMVDDYEQRIYAMESVEGMTTADFDRIIDDVCNDYFGAYGGYEYVRAMITDMQFYIRYVTLLNPGYYISYSTSLVTSLNLFALAREDRAAAQEQYRRLVEEAPYVEGYVAALNSCGAASPFDEESFKTIVNLFQ